jgi:glycerophosphoryl diester phosphodiesterase
MKRLPAFLLTMFLAHAASAIEIIAHRGYSQKAPENTVSSFKLAWENNTDACELDMYLTKDGKVVIIHDKDTKRTCGGVQKDVAGSTLAELRTLDAGSWKDPKYAGEKLPTLEEALATMPLGNNKRFFLEIKCGPEVVPALAAILEPMRARADQLVIISFNLEACAAAKKALPWVKNYLIVGAKDKQKKTRTDVSPFIEQAKTAGLDGLDLDMAWPWAPAMVKQIRDAGLGVYVWTVDKPADIAHFKALGVDGITTNEPVVVRQELAKP